MLFDTKKVDQFDEDSSYDSDNEAQTVHLNVSRNVSETLQQELEDNSVSLFCIILNVFLTYYTIYNIQGII